MSYDLMVFDPDVAPRDRDEFIAWYREQTKWGEGHSYNDPNISSQALRSWFLEMIKGFPALNGPYADEISDNPKQTDYCIGKSVIYSAFNWSQCRDAYRAVFELARKHDVGFYDVSGDEGQVWVPDSKGGYACIHAGREPLTPEEAVEDRARTRDSIKEFVKRFARDT
jgi:hypothetical protein